MSDDVAQLQQGQILGKDFKVLRPLAAGGMGAVYLVEQLSTGRERALKVMHPQFVKSQDSRDRFTQEAKVGARIRSDHVVEVVSAGVDDDTGIPWLAMELLDGEELARRIQKKGVLQPAETLEIFRQLCHALGEAHRNGLVHRDLKPQNIFMARSRRQGEAFTVKILDFGVAKLVQEQQGELDHTKPVGTPRWMAPEQSDQGAPIRPATDVWALGLIAFHCLTGKYYWRSANLAQSNVTALLREMIVEQIVPASQRAAELGCPGALPRGFDEWFARCLNREQSQRFFDANAAMEALAPVLENAPAWKPASLAGVVPDDSATTPIPSSLSHTPEVPHLTPSPPPGDDDSDTLQWGRLKAGPHKVNPTPQLSAPSPLITPPPGMGPRSGPGATKQFAQPPPRPDSTERLAQPEPPSRSPVPAIAGVGLGLVAVVIAAFAVLRKPAPAPAPLPVPIAVPAAPSLPDAFALVFESFPSGAEVFDGAQKLGTTPMQFMQKNAGLDNAPRKFRIVRQGFLPYEVMQGQSREKVVVLATLSVDPEASARAAAEAVKAQEAAKEKEKAERKRVKAPSGEEPELRTRR